MSNRIYSDDFGLFFSDSNNNELLSNEIIVFYGHGIEFISSSFNKITNNIVHSHDWHGIYLDSSSSNNILYHNDIGTSSMGSNEVVLDKGTNNDWNCNHYLTYDQPVQGCYDVDPIDGICDDPLVIPGPSGSIDLYPLTSWSPVESCPGIVVTIESVDKMAGGADLSAEYNVIITSITTENEDVELTIRPADPAELLAGEQPADISWFDWTSQSYNLAPGQIRVFPLHVILPVGISEGDYRFVADGRATIPCLPCPLPQETSSDSQEIVVVTDSTIPEFPTIAIPIISILGIMLLMSRRKGKKS